MCDRNANVGGDIIAVYTFPYIQEQLSKNVMQLICKKLDKVSNLMKCQKGQSHKQGERSSNA